MGIVAAAMVGAGLSLAANKSMKAAKAAKVSTNAAQDVAEDEKVAKKARATLLETSGGILGEEVASGRKTLLGN